MNRMNSSSIMKKIFTDLYLLGLSCSEHFYIMFEINKVNTLSNQSVDFVCLNGHAYQLGRNRFIKISEVPSHYYDYSKKIRITNEIISYS